MKKHRNIQMEVDGVRCSWTGSMNNMNMNGCNALIPKPCVPYHYPVEIITVAKRLRCDKGCLDPNLL